MSSTQVLNSLSVVHKKKDTQTRIFNLFIFLFLLFTLGMILFFPENYRKLNFKTIELWVVVIIPSIVPMYILSSLLFSFPYLSKFFFPILTPIMHFENEKACSLFLLSLLTGQPTISILLSQAIKNKEISFQEGNRLMRFTSHLSPLFIIGICKLISFSISYLAWLIIGIEILTSILIAFFSKGSPSKTFQESKNPSLDVSRIIDECPKVMLNILMVMIIVTLIQFPFRTLFSGNQLLFIRFPLDLLEITVGLNSILSYSIPEIFKIVLMTFALSLGGVSIELQVLHAIKKTRLSTRNYLFYRFLHGFLASLIILGFLLLILFL